MSQTLLEMAKDLVMAQIEARNLSPDEMHQALQHTYASLKALQAQEDANGSVAVITPETPPEPVNWKKSITKHTVTCLESSQGSWVRWAVISSQVWDSTDTTIGSQREHGKTEADRSKVKTMGEGSDVCEGTGEGKKGCSAEIE